MRIPVLALIAILITATDDPPAATPPPVGEFLVIPLRLHVLTAEDLPEVDCKLTDDDLKRILGKVNKVWHQAGVHWGLESIVREPAARQERFRVARELSGKSGVPLGAFRSLMPEKTRAETGLNVYYIHKFSVNGVYLGDRIAFVQETAKLREVKGGIDEPIPRVTAHELGHALGLPHRQAMTNLLASGTTGTTLNTAEVETARATAKTVPGVMTHMEIQTRAETEESPARRAALARWLEEITN
ncbi:MAG: Matrixin [Planctomycetota bacterium]|nr:Matrixin [Planctomycetota bacterium]